MHEDSVQVSTCSAKCALSIALSIFSGRHQRLFMRYMRMIIRRLWLPILLVIVFLCLLYRLKHHAAPSKVFSQHADNLFASQLDPDLIPSSHRFCNIYRRRRPVQETFASAQLKTSRGVLPIYVFGPNDLLSSQIRREGIWEYQRVSHVLWMFSQEPDLHLIDLGAGFGVYTIVAAAFGRRVLAVEANLAAVKRLHRSLYENHLLELVTLVQNGLWDASGADLRVAYPSDNVGAAAVLEESTRLRYYSANQRTLTIVRRKDAERLGLSPSGGAHRAPPAANPNADGNGAAPAQGADWDTYQEYTLSELLRSVRLDDLLDVVPFERAILKMDLEGSEARALRGAHRFFSAIDIPLVLFEWGQVRENERDEVREFFYQNGYDAYSIPESNVPLRGDFSWPWEIVWKRRGPFRPRVRDERPADGPAQPPNARAMATTRRPRPRTYAELQAALRSSDAAAGGKRAASECLAVYPATQDEARLVRDANFPLTLLQTPLGDLGVYTFDAEDLISAHVQAHGVWERERVAHLLHALTLEPDLHLIDIGSSFGVFSLAAARAGHMAVAVDANIDNLRRLAKSLLLGQYQPLVTVVHNAVSDKACDWMQVVVETKNVGGSGVVPASAPVAALAEADAGEAGGGGGESRGGGRPERHPVRVRSITLDDLVPLLEVLDIRRAVLKIDIEGGEFLALHAASQLFSSIDIPVVYFEWGVDAKGAPRPDPSDWTATQSVQSERHLFIREFFTSRNYLPYRSPTARDPLSKTDAWPFDIVWMRRGALVQRRHMPLNLRGYMLGPAVAAVKTTMNTTKGKPETDKNDKPLVIRSEGEERIETNRKRLDALRLAATQMRPRKRWQLTLLSEKELLHSPQAKAFDLDQMGHSGAGVLARVERALAELDDPRRFLKARLMTKFGDLHLYTFGLGDLISERLLKHQTWESGALHSILSELRRDPQLHLIDVGSHFGTFTLPALMLGGHRVVAVDPNVRALKLLLKSAVENRFDTRLLTLVQNAVSDSYEELFLWVPEASNVGGAQMLTSSELSRRGFSLNSSSDSLWPVPIRTVLLDDLLDVAPFERAILKLDLEGGEARALRFGARLFESLEIPLVFMEWGKLADDSRKMKSLRVKAAANEKVQPKASASTNETAALWETLGSVDYVRSFFGARGYQPFAFVDSVVRLPSYDVDSWPWDIVWKKISRDGAT